MKIPSNVLHPLVRKALGQSFSSRLVNYVNPKISLNAVIRHNVRMFGIHNITVRDGSIVDFSCDLQAWGEIYIGKNVIISPHSVILTGSHNIQTEQYGSLIKSVFIDDYAWVAYGAMILPGIRIGRGAVVGAGSVVTRDVEPFSIVGGNPAKHLKWREMRDLSYVPASWHLPSLCSGTEAVTQDNS